ncbi:class I SAM-dependent methyltransferase [Gracilibacillus sp. YIM 98692]|uniref:class I SAM-dependent methyltransferase n=1 Tax=Gracilibacillus sp. YIM 98692 TaxID=2663532 RepID=UPI0013D5C2D5|nr:class I SAM-dependent methyltransferase [Gracilibacillus sp. YIM 98692]
MADQYFSKFPDVKSDPKSWEYILNGYRFTFKTDNGVFSKNEVDFGSKTLIEAFELPEVRGPLLDLGCGYGPVGLALAKTYPERKIVGSDVNVRALHLAKQNAKVNKVSNIRFVESDMLNSLQGERFAAILTNPPIRAGKQIVHEMFEQSSRSLQEGGELWVVIQKKQGAPSARKKLEELFSSVKVVSKNKGYFILRAK